ncbi:8-oxo-dGTP pyrophosphatase MutT (NUDIX family) [Bacillus mesophilus]|uniref:NUDIX domain-containing protein n=1 Tax=Bacillus mesophilus TaxID=1808955 RepID=A0A6M0QBT8_9BACI|nr:NUDIX domain-containing protein [Bacillus mesophilus]MBM7662149.1 8-oxo-dGTP pyrophosphatase MutT (NUDIX family) [Bacillus mesophilus]NEY72498.1 NUDIX domain-containing protein [Bacillus mesophilus]
MKWEDSYIGKLRGVAGSQKLIVPSVRAIIENESGKVLFVKRFEKEKWGMPAGSIELGESIYECLCREVKEETGLDVITANVIACYTHPKYGTKNEFNDEYQLFELLFWVNKWEGTVKQNTNETISASFFSKSHLPNGTNEFWTSFHKEVLDDLALYKTNGQLILK